MMPANTTNAPNPPTVAPSPPDTSPESGEPPPAPNATTELSTVSITTATTSSRTVTPIANCDGFSWADPVSCSILPMMADEDTISMAARNSVSVGLSPMAAPSARVEK